MKVEDYFNFISKIDIKGKEECWPWIAGLNGKMNYGRFRLGQKRYLAHRFVWMLIKGEIPKGLLVCHKCDNPSCVNPNHLTLGTHKDNNNDRDQKGRFHPLKGTDNGFAKLTKQEVLKIRRLKGIISQRKLAAQFKVSRATIENILHKRTYTNV